MTTLFSIRMEQNNTSQLIAALETVECPSTDPIDEMEFNAAVFSLKSGLETIEQSPEKFNNKPCAVCGASGHSFQRCPKFDNILIIKNFAGQVIAYYKKVYKLCKQLNISMDHGADIPLADLTNRVLPCMPLR